MAHALALAPTVYSVSCGFGGGTVSVGVGTLSLLAAWDELCEVLNPVTRRPRVSSIGCAQVNRLRRSSLYSIVNCEM